MNRSRYQRQLLIDGWSESIQNALQNKTVFIAGAGGLGAPVIAYLAAAGVGTLRICDSDDVEISNLNRQVLFTEGELGEPKAQSALKCISKLNPEINGEAFAERIDSSTVERLIGKSDVVVDCCDNYKTRLVLNQFAVSNGLPFVHAGVQAMQGQLTFIHTPETPCLRCLLPEKIEELSPKPIVGAAAGVMGSLQAMEVIKFLTGTGDVLKNRMLLWDGVAMIFQVIPVQRNKDCPICSQAGEAGK